MSLSPHPNITTTTSEHVRQRKLDTERLLQRNKNVLKILDGRHSTEEREIVAEIKKSLLVPRSAAGMRTRLDSGRTKAKLGGFGDELVSGATMIAKREMEKRERERAERGSRR